MCQIISDNFSTLIEKVFYSIQFYSALSNHQFHWGERKWDYFLPLNSWFILASTQTKKEDFPFSTLFSSWFFFMILKLLFFMRQSCAKSRYLLQNKLFVGDAFKNNFICTRISFVELNKKKIILVISVRVSNQKESRICIKIIVFCVRRSGGKCESLDLLIWGALRHIYGINWLSVVNWFPNVLRCISIWVINGQFNQNSTIYVNFILKTRLKDWLNVEISNNLGAVIRRSSLQGTR